MTTIRTLAAAALLGTAAAAAAQHAGHHGQGHGSYAGQQTREIKALADGDVAALLDGQGMGYAKAAELNGYPGPMHTLELRDRLGLTAQQAAATEALMREHKARARALGARLVEAERRLDALFAARQAEPRAVEEASRAAALLQAELRAEHLNTHVAQTALLSAEQIQRYARLRGYAGERP